MEEVKPKKVFVLGDATAVATIIKDTGCVLTTKKEEAELIVCVMSYQDVGQHQQSLELFGQSVEQFLYDEDEDLTISEQVPIVYAFTTVTNIRRNNSRISEELSRLNITSHLPLVIITEPVNHGGREELKKQLVSITSPKKAQQTEQEQLAAQFRNLRGPSASGQSASFFAYPQTATRSHTRQERNMYAIDKLQIKGGDEESVKTRKLVLLFAHYMSLRHTILNIGHVNSAVSRSVEDELAKGLNYQGDRESDRATVRGHKYDRVAKEFKQLILAKFPEDQRKDVESFINKLIDLLSCADSLERGFFDYPTKSQDIYNIIRAVTIAYENKFERPEQERPNNVQDLPSEAQEKFNLLYYDEDVAYFLRTGPAQ